MMLWQVVFWLCACVIVYVYAGYPLLVRLLAHLLGKGVARAPIRPTVTVVIAAYNEARGIRAKLENVSSLDYPRDLVDLVVASDASSDGTDEIVKAFAPARVRLLRVEGRQGKTACQNAAVQNATGEVVVFTDATTRIETHALSALTANFADPAVGCAAGSLVYETTIENPNSTGKGGEAYWSYELSLRRAESALGSLVGVSGCLYAVRRSAYRPIAPELISDFVIALHLHEQGLRTVLEPAAVCFEETLAQAGQELSMRVRVAVRSINALVAERRLLNPLRYGRFAWQLWSHKVLRYASPLFWIVALGTSLALAADPLYLALFALQVLLIAAGIAGFLLQARRPGLLTKPYYFLLTNVASLFAILRYLRGERIVTWKPIR
jgi:cellulose synthase/poly-beta-1,6-N-acetylglucosamine synthase-like glycosyltransferase